MKKPEQPITIKTAVTTVVAVALLAAAFTLTGLTSFGSYEKVMFSENKDVDSWRAQYFLLTGSINRNINLGEEKCNLSIAVVTKSGHIHLKIIGTDGTSYFDREDIQTSTYNITAKGSVRITVIANGHRGSFLVEKENY